MKKSADRGSIMEGAKNQFFQKIDCAKSVENFFLKTRKSLKINDLKFFLTSGPDWAHDRFVPILRHRRKRGPFHERGSVKA